MNNLKEFIIEKLKIDKDSEVKNKRSEEEIKKESVLFVKYWLKENTKYKYEDEDYDIKVKDDYLILLLYCPYKNELEEIGDKLNKALKEEDLINQYFELGSTNKTNSGKKLVFHLNIERIISREDFYKTTFKRTRRNF